MDPFFGQGDIGSLFGRSSSRSGFHGDMFEEPPGSPSHSGSPSGMELAPLYSSSSGHLGGRESITDILRRYQGPPRSESFGGFEDDYEENEESHVNFDAHGAHIGARVSRTQQTPFGPISCGASMQMSIGRGGVSIRTTSSASLAGGGHGRTMLMSLSMGSQRHHSCGGMGGGLFGPFGGMFSPFGGLMPPFGGMFALGSGSFDHMSPHAMEDIFEGRGRSSDNYSGPIIEEMEEDDYTQLALTDKSDQRANEKEIDASLGLGLLASTEESDDECTTPSTTDAETGMILNESILVSKRSNLPVTSDFPEQTSLENMNDNIVTDEKIHNETKNYPMYGKSSSPILGLHPKDSIPQEDTDTSFGDEDLSSFDGKTDMFQNHSTNFVKSPTTIPDEVSEIIETSLSQDDMFPSLNEITVQKDTLDTSRNLGFDMDLPQADTEKPKEKESTSDEEDSHNASGQYSSNNIMPSTHMSSKNQDYSIFHTELDNERIYHSSAQTEKMTPDFKLQRASPRNKKFTKLKFNDVKFGFGDSKILHQEREASFSHNSTELSTLQLPDKEYKNPEKVNVLPNDANKEKTKICQVVQEIVFSENRQDLLKPEEHCEQNAQSHPGQLIEPCQQEQASPLDELIVQNAQGRRGQPDEVGGLGQPDEQELDQPNYRGQPDEPPAATEQGDTDQPDPEQLVTEQSFTSKHLISTKNNASAGSKFSSRRNELSYRPQDSDLNPIQEGTDTPINRTHALPQCKHLHREGTDTPINRTHALPKCKHLHTHIHGCCHSYCLHCNDCGMHIHSPAEINAIEAANKHEDEIFNHPEWQFLKEFSVDYGTSAMFGTKKPRNKNAIPRPTTAEGIDKTNGHSCCEHARPKSATGPELSTLVESIGLTLKDVHPDGNCLFTSVVDQLRIRGDFSYTSRDLRHAAVDYLEANPNQDDGTPLSAFLTGYERNWETYLSSMRHEGHWGDHHTIWALANVLKKKIVIYRGDKELHRTLVEPSRANREKSADNEDIDKEKSKDKEDVGSILDLEEMHLGHISESHYVSLRPADWHEQLMTILKTKHSPAIVGCNPDSKRLDSNDGVSARKHSSGFSATHINFFINYIRRGDFIHERQTRIDPCADKLGIAYYTGDIINGFEYKITGSYKMRQRPSMRQDYRPTILVTPHDTSVISDKRLGSNAKELISVTEGYKPGQMCLVPVAPNIWYPMLEPVGAHICLKHIAVQNQRHYKEQEHHTQNIAFKCDWPLEAEEWRTRVRKHGWPRSDTIDDVMETGARIVPAPKQVSQSTREDETTWEYNFDIAEQIVCRKDLSRPMKTLYCMLKKLLRFSFYGKNIISTKHMKNIVLFVCEGCSFDEIRHEPEKCLLFGIEKLEDFLKCRHFPDYFMKKRNILCGVDYAELSWHIDMLHILKQNMMVILYFAVDKYDVSHQFELGNVFDVLNKMAVLGADDSSRKETLLRQVCATSIRCWVVKKKFILAHKLIDTWTADLSRIINDEAVLRDQLVHDVLDELSEQDRWLFALFLDSQEETNMLQETVRGQNCFSLKVLFGNQVIDILGKGTDIKYSEIPVPALFLGENLTRFARRFGDMLYENIGSVTAYQFAIHHFLKEQTHDVLLGIENDQKDNRGQYTMMKLSALREMFRGLYQSYLDTNEVHRFRELMELYEEMCNFYDTETEFSFLSELWRYFGELERADEADMKAVSVKEEYEMSTRV